MLYTHNIGMFMFLQPGVPDPDARFEILQVLLAKAPHSIPDGDLRSLANRAHGYVGADLGAVVREAGTLAIKRWVKQQPSPIAETITPPLDLVLTLKDLADALPSVRPSAMRSVFLETPPVRYSDIGGQTIAIQKLREMVEWPLLHPESFRRLGVRPPKGLLLYGPPGCSKTVLARACATESGINFVAVKGPEVRACLTVWQYGQPALCCSAPQQVRRGIGTSGTGNFQKGSLCIAIYHFFRALFTPVQ